MTTDAQCADLCAAIYEGKDSQIVKWDYFDEGEDDGICWALVRTQSEDVIVLRGSKTVEDWFRDLIALALPFSHHGLGPVHPGFLLGMEHAWSEIKPMLTKLNAPIVTGHSLGAGRAAILCGLMVLDGVPPARRVCFGSPRPGFANLGQVVAKVPSASYRNGFDWNHDLVTDVPFTLPFEEYVHPEPLTNCSAAPDPNDRLGVFAYHHMALYQKALQRIGGVGP